jgi:hypothetical protein
MAAAPRGNGRNGGNGSKKEEKGLYNYMYTQVESGVPVQEAVNTYASSVKSLSASHAPKEKIEQDAANKALGAYFTGLTGNKFTGNFTEHNPKNKVTFVVPFDNETLTNFSNNPTPMSNTYVMGKNGAYIPLENHVAKILDPYEREAFDNMFGNKISGALQGQHIDMESKNGFLSFENFVKDPTLLKTATPYLIHRFKLSTDKYKVHDYNKVVDDEVGKGGADDDEALKDDKKKAAVSMLKKMGALNFYSRYNGNDGSWRNLEFLKPKAKGFENFGNQQDRGDIQGGGNFNTDLESIF